MGRVLDVEGLNVRYHVRGEALPALDDVSFSIDDGEILGVVGESGCGKSTLVSSLLGLLPRNGEITSGRIDLGGRDVTRMSGEELRDVRGAGIATVFQDPLTSLNPTFTVGRQLVEVQRAHPRNGRLAGAELRRRAAAQLSAVGIPDAEERLDAYPHEFSGGMRQRVMIAMALLLSPKLLVADEATSALDVSLQAQILDLLRDLRDARGTAMLVISHDLGIIGEISDRVAVMYAGRVIETGSVEEILTDPKHPYTRALLRAAPSRNRRSHRLATIPGRVPALSDLPSGCAFRDRCDHAEDLCANIDPAPTRLGGRTVRCLGHDPASGHPGLGEVDALPDDRNARPFSVGGISDASSGAPLLDVQRLVMRFEPRLTILDRLARRQPPGVQAVSEVDLQVARGEIVGVVGESGSGKTTLGKAVLGLVHRTAGTVTFDDRPQDDLDRAGWRAFRRRAQIILQETQASLSPRLTIGELLEEPYRIHDVPVAERSSATELLDMVELSSEQLGKYPHELSGGQARRVGIARALALRPQFLVADEPTAGLDVSAAASVLNLLSELRDELDLTYLIITHDLNVVGHIADRIAVMYLGRIVEQGPADRILHRPHHPYTKGLIDAAPEPGAFGTDRDRVDLEGEIPSPTRPPAGCHFHPRCPWATEECVADAPVLEQVEPGHTAACVRWSEIAAGAPPGSRGLEVG